MDLVTATPHRDPGDRDEGAEGSPQAAPVTPLRAVLPPAVETPPPTPRARARRHRRFSSLSWRILAINVLALAILLGGLLFLGQYRDGLIEAKKGALLTQGEIIAGSLGQSAVTGAPSTIELDFALSRELIPRLVLPTGTRARLFNIDGRLVADSQTLAAASRDVLSRALPPPADEGLLERAVGTVYDWLFETSLGRPGLPPYVEREVQTATDYEEVVGALGGEASAVERVAAEGEVIINAVLPVQRFKKVLGALMLTSETADIVDSVRAVRLAILEVFLAALAITVLLSLFLAGTIARPVRRLADAADRVRSGPGQPVAIPDFTERGDEIGDLSLALRDMTAALYQRLNAIEAFAADVAHEIRNPLSSLQSAVEALERTSDTAQRDKLAAIIKDDIQRLDRLIGDISDASRIDAELSRAAMTPVDVGGLVRTLAQVYGATEDEGALQIEVDVVAQGPLVVTGLEERLGQVLRNLIDNARSFSPPAGTIRVRVVAGDGEVTITVDDDGPGIPEENLEAVFDRFYRARPAGESFGIHSGLGLSISRQIVGAHGGTIHAENWRDAEGRIGGARFVVWLPA